MSIVQWQHLLLAVLGISGILEYYGAQKLPVAWSKRKRVYLGAFSAIFYVTQILNAFTSLMQASALELFGFVGCFLGCLGAVRVFGSEATDAVDVDAK